jgi:hypothetical protein
MVRFQGRLLLIIPILITGCLKTTVSSVTGTANQQLSVVSGSLSFNVNWAANREAAVNKAGGGYKVYYGVQPGFNLTTAPFVSVPYVSGPSAPTTATVSGVAAGNYYVRIVAYSSLASGASSSPSAEFSITIP